MPLPSVISVPRINWGKRKDRSVMGNFRTIDGQFIIGKELTADENCAVWEDLIYPKKFLIDPENQYQAEDGHWHQTYDIRSQIPLSLRKPSSLKDGKNDADELSKISDQIFGVTSDHTEFGLYKKLEDGDQWNKLTWIISIVCGSLLIIAGMHYLWG